MKKLIQTLLTLIASLIMICAAWIGDKVASRNPPLPSNENVRIYSTDRGSLEQAYIQSVNSAKKSILIMIFALTDDKLMRAIRQKSEEGVSVKIVCDAKACPNIVKRLGPKVEIIRRLDQGLMHLKIMVIDEKDCWIGSANFTGESLKMHANLVIEIIDEALAKNLEIKASTLNEYERTGSLPHTEYTVGGQEIELSFLPDDRKAPMRIRDLIRSAKKSIRIAMFTWTRTDFAYDVINAHKRGIDVQVVLDRNSANGSSSKIADLLKKEGIPITYSIGKALLHHKFMLVDESVLEIGSANWTKSAFSTNDDCFLIIHNLTDDQRQKMNEVWEETVTNSS